MDTTEKIHSVIVHSFRIGDVEDPEIYAAEPILKWQETDAGKFVMANAVETPVYYADNDHVSYGIQYSIVAKLESKKLSEFYLRWGKHGRQ